MVVTMVAMGMMQVSIDQIVGMVPVRYRFMTAARAVAMRRIMTATAVVRCAAIGIRGAYLDDMLVDVTIMRMMQMAIVQVIGVSLMPNRDVPATWSMDMGMIGVDRMIVRSHAGSFRSGLRIGFNAMRDPRRSSRD
jgi:hypothetical protein